MAWICSQLGAGEHYAIPRALCQAGRLHRLYTDFWAGCALRKAAAALRLRKLGPLAARFHPDLANAPVTAWNVRALVWEANARARASRNGPAGRYLSFVEVGRRFAEATRDALRRDNTLTKEAVFFAYDTAALEALEFLRERGVRCVVDQMDPGRVEVNVVREEEKRWAGWQDGATDVPEAWFRRREQEWALADRVVVNSEFSRQALLQQGVPGEKLVVIPLCFEAQSAKREAQGAKREALPASRLPPPASRLPPPASRFALAASRLPLRVLWLGQVILRKGIQYLMEAARQLAG